MIESRETLGTSPAHGRLAIAGALVLALSLTAVIAVSAEAKKKGGKNKAFEESVTVNAGIPDVPAAGPSTAVKSTIKVGKKFKRKVVGDVNVTGIQTTGSADGALSDLNFKLTAPSGRSVYLITNFSGGSNVLSGQNLGPLTLDDDTSVSVCNAVPPATCADPSQ